MSDNSRRPRSAQRISSPVMPSSILSTVLLLAFLSIDRFGLVNGIPALQSGPDSGPSYAGGMAYDKTLNVAYLTGATYGDLFGGQSSDSSGCFLGIAKLPDELNDNIDWIEKEKYGNGPIPAACISLTLSPQQRGAYLIGGTEEGGLLTSIRSPGSHKAEQYGFVLDVAVDRSNPNMEGSAGSGRATKLMGGALLQDEAVQYPKAITSDATNSYIYVATMHTEDTSTNDEYKEHGGDELEHPNFTSGGLKKFGNSYDMIVERMKIEEIPVTTGANGDDLEETLSPTWRKSFGLTSTNNAVEPSDTVHVTGMVEIASAETLVIVGSTRGSGPAFGAASGNGDMDGFMTTLQTAFKTASGNLVEADAGGLRVARLDSANSKDDWITSICAPPPATGANNPLDKDVFFVVGSTSGQVELNGNVPESNYYDAYIAMIDLESLEPLWSKQLPVTGGNMEGGGAASYGIACAVSSDRSLVYFVGGVEDGAALSGETSKGGDDFFVAQFDTVSGDMNWIRQAGTAGDDWLAHGGALAVDKFDNAIVYGDTTGSLFRKREENSKNERDIFLGIFHKEKGAYIDPAEKSGLSNNGGAGDDFLDLPPGTEDSPKPGDNSNGDPADNGNLDMTKDESIPKPKHKTSRSKFLVWIVVLLVATLMATFLAVRLKHQKDVATERSHVFSYLQGFDVEDVDLRHSATGGWHGTYVNKLAHGVNKADPMYPTSGEKPGSFAFETAPLTHSSVVRDSLFVDVDSKPVLGADSDLSEMGTEEGTQSSGSGSQRVGYDGLVGAYDSAYSDMGPRSYSDRKSSLEAGSTNKPWGREII